MIERYLVNSEIKYGKKIFPQINGSIYFEPKDNFFYIKKDLIFYTGNLFPYLKNYFEVRTILNSIPSPDRRTLIKTKGFYKSILNSENSILLELELDFLDENKKTIYFINDMIHLNSLKGRVLTKNLLGKFI